MNAFGLKNSTFSTDQDKKNMLWFLPNIMSKTTKETVNASKSKFEIPLYPLLTTMREKPELWNKNHEHYKNKQLKELAWDDICSAIDPEYPRMEYKRKICFRMYVACKWSNLRDSYIKCIKLTNSKPYVYASLMDFLDTTKSGIETADNDSVKSEETLDSDDDTNSWEKHDNNTEDECNKEFTNIFDEASCQGEPQSKMIKIKTEPKMFYTATDVSCTETNMSTTEPNMSTTETNMSNSETNASFTDTNIASMLTKIMCQEDDEDVAFFKSITSAVKSLSEDSKLEFRIKVLKAIRELKKEENE